MMVELPSGNLCKTFSLLHQFFYQQLQHVRAHHLMAYVQPFDYILVLVLL